MFSWLESSITFPRFSSIGYIVCFLKKKLLNYIRSCPKLFVLFVFQLYSLGIEKISCHSSRKLGVLKDVLIKQRERNDLLILPTKSIYSVLLNKWSNCYWRFYSWFLFLPITKNAFTSCKGGYKWFQLILYLSFVPIDAFLKIYHDPCQYSMYETLPSHLQTVFWPDG